LDAKYATAFELGRLLLSVAARATLLDVLCRMENRGLMVVSPSSLEVLLQTDDAERLVRKWFPDDALRTSLPERFFQYVRGIVDLQPWTAHSSLYTVSKNHEVLLIEFSRIGMAAPEFSKACLISMREAHPRRSAPSSWMEQLTAQQFKVASEIVVRGASDKDISRALKCEVATVKRHVREVLRRMEVKTRLELCVLAHRYH
jgi:DNA-binding CsgD family transcriptional regulator